MTETEAIAKLQLSLDNWPPDPPTEHDRAIYLAIKALRKQEPQHPFVVNGYFLCPCCGVVELHNFGVEYTDCCGQRIDWEGPYDQGQNK